MKLASQIVLFVAFSVPVWCGAADLKQSKFTQIVNDVKVVSAADKSQKSANVNEMFKLPDMIRTGPSSRAELVAEDKTITRVGANTIFSFNAATRTVDLEKGTLLFHAPKGKGGGIIKSGSAVAAVLGTTIMVGATPDGGFKVVVLEGTAKVKLNNGQTEILKAGQMVFVLPNEKLSPVITFRLDLLVTASKLIQGFDTPLPSSDLINLAIDEQKHLIDRGVASDTGLEVGDIATITGVQVVDVNSTPPSLDRERVSPPALDLDAIISAPTLDVSHLFLTPTAVTGLPFEGNFVGFFARNITFVNGSQTVDLTPYHNLPNFTFLASGSIKFENSVHFTGNSESYGDLSLIAADTITVAPESSLSYSGSGFFIQALNSMSFDSVTFQNYNGILEVSSGGALAIKGSDIIGYGVTLGGASSVTLDDLYVSGYGSGGGRPAIANVSSPYGQVYITSGGQVTIRDTSINGNQIKVASAAGSINVDSCNFYGSTLAMRAANIINVNSCTFSFNTINMAAKTIILNNINFGGSANVYLQSQFGLLAANPNTGASPVAGYVNFVSNVNYGGDAAQNHVNPSSGTGIFIYKLGEQPPTQGGGTGTVSRASSKIK
ncbi:MAG: iron dicitrate transport regulator FecR [Verrucomicrobiales bacterium]|nr:iron dicitrate transport regulator FecR [Verrucomicrobiales bacterium]